MTLSDHSAAGRGGRRPRKVVVGVAVEIRLVIICATIGHSPVIPDGAFVCLDPLDWFFVEDVCRHVPMADGGGPVRASVELIVEGTVVDGLRGRAIVGLHSAVEGRTDASVVGNGRGGP